MSLYFKKTMEQHNDVFVLLSSPEHADTYCNSREPRSHVKTISGVSFTPITAIQDKEYRARSSGSNTIILFVDAFLPQTFCLFPRSAVLICYFAIKVHV